MNRKCKTVSFDLQDSHELSLLAHAEKKVNGKFSKYIKRLIIRDMENFERVQAPPINGVPSAMIIDATNQVDQDFSGFL